MYKWASFIVLVAIILVIGALFYKILSGFFVPLFLATILVVVFQPVQRWLLPRCRNSKPLSAAITTAAIALVVIVPALLIITIAILEGVAALGQGRLDKIPDRLDALRSRVGLDLPYEEYVRSVDMRMKALSEQVRDGGMVGDNVIDEAIASVEELRTELMETPEEPLTQRLDEMLVELRRAKDSRDRPTDFDQAIRVANASYQTFRNVLCGGVIWRTLIDLARPSEEQRRAWSSSVANLVQRYVLPVGGAAAVIGVRLIIGLVIMLVAVYFFLVDGPGMVDAAMRLSPLADRYEEELLVEFSQISRSVVIATLLSAFVQAVLAGIGFRVAGVQSVFLLSLLTFLFAIIPFVGSASVWVPVTLWLYFIDQRVWAAVLLFLYGALVVSLADNVVKTVVLHGRAQLHPLLALLSVLGGVQAMGPIGILVGPMIVVYLQALLKILQREMIQMDQKGAVQP